MRSLNLAIVKGSDEVFADREVASSPATQGAKAKPTDAIVVSPGAHQSLTSAFAWDVVRKVEKRCPEAVIPSDIALSTNQF